jgi:hypothetical protein
MEKLTVKRYKYMLIAQQELLKEIYKTDKREGICSLEDGTTLVVVHDAFAFIIPDNALILDRDRFKQVSNLAFALKGERTAVKTPTELITVGSGKLAYRIEDDKGEKRYYAQNFFGYFKDIGVGCHYEIGTYKNMHLLFALDSYDNILGFSVPIVVRRN